MLYIYMANAWTVAPGSTLTLRTAQSVLAEPINGQAFTGSVTVGTGCAVSDMAGNLMGLTGDVNSCTKVRHCFPCKKREHVWL